MTSKHLNHALFLMALSVCLGFVFVCGASTVLAQTATNSSSAGTFDKRPLQNFYDKLINWRENEHNDIHHPFEYSFEATVGKDGKLTFDPANPTKFTGKPETEKIIKTGFAALSSSGMLKLLGVLQNQKLKFVASQDGTRFQFNAEMQQATEAKARSLRSALMVAIEAGKIVNDGDEEKEALELLNMTQVEATGNAVVIKAQMPNALAETLYQKYKNKAGAKK